MQHQMCGKGFDLCGRDCFAVGLATVLFKELNIPRHWIPVFVGLALIVSGAAASRIKSLQDHRES